MGQERTDEWCVLDRDRGCEEAASVGVYVDGFGEGVLFCEVFGLKAFDCSGDGFGACFPDIIIN